MHTVRKISLPFGLPQVEIAALGTIMVAIAAAAVRAWALGSESAWIDEAYSIVLSRLNLPQMIQGTAADQHPPLYYFLLHFWLSFGGDVVMARMLSVLLGVITVIQVIYLGASLSKNIWIGITAGLFLALAPMNVWYSREVRMYILLAVLTIAATVELWHGLHSTGTRHWVLYAAFCILAIYTHYFSSFTFLSHGGILLTWLLWKRQVKQFVYWFGSMILLLLAFLPWARTAVDQVLYHKMTWLPDPTPAVMRDTLVRVIFGATPPFFPGFINGLILFAAIAIFFGMGFYIRKQQPDDLPAYIFILLWFTIPVVTVCAISFLYPIFQYKQFIIVLAPIMLLFAWIISHLPVKALRLAAIGLVAVVYLAGTVAQEAYLTKDDWRAAAAYIMSQSQPGDLIYSNPSASSLALDLYLADETVPDLDGYPPDYNILTGGWHKSGVLQHGQAEPLLQEAVDGYERIWLVEFIPELWDPAEYMEKWLAERGQLVSDRSITRIRVRLYQLQD